MKVKHAVVALMATILVVLAGAFAFSASATGGTATTAPPSSTSPLYYSGQGSDPLDVQCDASNTPYLLFVLTGMSGATNISLNGITVTSTKNPGHSGTWQFTTAYEDPSSLINVVNATWAGTVGNAQLVISHGCPGSTPSSPPTTEPTSPPTS
jgi:hypothetical protein